MSQMSERFKRDVTNIHLVTCRMYRVTLNSRATDWSRRFLVHFERLYEEWGVGSVLSEVVQ